MTIVANKAFDINENNTSNICGGIVKVKWHSKCSETLVILTEKSFLYYVTCKNMEGFGNFVFSIKLQIDLSNFESVFSVLYGEFHNCQVDMMDEKDFVGKHGKKLDLSLALGNKCVDFDFGSVFTFCGGLFKEKVRDCSVFVLYESGE